MRLLLRILGMGLGFGFLGVLAGAFLALLFSPRLAVRWEPLGNPEGEVVSEIAGVDGVSVFVITQSGTTYECCWTPYSGPITRNPHNLEVSDYPFEIPGSPGKVIDGVEVVSVLGEISLTQKYVLIEDRSVMRWQYASDTLSSLNRIVQAMIYGLMIGILGGTILAIRQSASNPAEPNDEGS